jgi:nicotinate-nucleotide pyrophosphorylase (carboxylating)
MVSAPRPVEPSVLAVREVVTRALMEDLTPLGDVTASLLPPTAEATAELVPRSDGVLAGRRCVDETYAQLDPSVSVTWEAGDGDRVVAGQRVALLAGPLAPLLTGERTALNLLGHLSGVATLTARYVDAVAATGSDTRVWDTRKTTPGLRALEKAAVRAGGGSNHRGNLSDWVMLKDNHLAWVGITVSVERARVQWPGRAIHVECDSLEQVMEALDAQADAILLDNMSPADVSDSVARRDERFTGCLLEASGGISLDTVAGFARTGVDMISVGAITNSAPVLDVGLDITPLL